MYIETSKYAKVINFFCRYNMNRSLSMHTCYSTANIPVYVCTQGFLYISCIYIGLVIVRSFTKLTEKYVVCSYNGSSSGISDFGRPSWITMLYHFRNCNLHFHKLQTQLVILIYRNLCLQTQTGMC